MNFFFSIFHFQVYQTENQYFKTIEGRTASKIGMRLQLQSVHFGGGPVMNGGGQLILRCTAQIGNLYQEYTEKELGVPQKDPIPARGVLKFFGDFSLENWLKLFFFSSPFFTTVTSSIAIATAASLLYTLLTTFVTLTHQHLR